MLPMLRMKRLKKLHINGKQKREVHYTFIKLSQYQLKAITRGIEGNYEMMKDSINQKDITIGNTKNKYQQTQKENQTAFL